MYRRNALRRLRVPTGAVTMANRGDRLRRCRTRRSSNRTRLRRRGIGDGRIDGRAGAARGNQHAVLEGFQRMLARIPVERFIATRPPSCMTRPDDGPSMNVDDHSPIRHERRYRTSHRACAADDPESRHRTLPLRPRRANRSAAARHRARARGHAAFAFACAQRGHRDDVRAGRAVGGTPPAVTFFTFTR